jgi:hypothetical protein
MNLSNLIKGKDRFPLEAGLAMQATQLQGWAKKLTPEAMALVQEEACLQNQTLPDDATGYDVWRGDSITLFVVEMDLK